MDEFSLKLNQSGIGGNISGHLVTHLGYVGDLCLISMSSAVMQSLLDLCSTYAIEHLFHVPTFHLNKLEIPRVDQCKYLGIMVNTKNCNIDMIRQMRKFHYNINIVYRKFSKCSSDVKCMLFKSFCPNMYCTTMWYNCTVTAMRKLKISYNNSLRRLLNISKHNK